LLRRGQIPDGVNKLREVIRLQPESAEARFQYAVALMAQDAVAEAISQYREAIRLAPSAAPVLNNLAWILATYPNPQFRNGTEASDLARRACELSSYQEPIFLGTLGAAYAEAGQFEQAREAAQKACKLASSTGQTNLLARNEELLKLYAAGKPYREPANR